MDPIKGRPLTDDQLVAIIQQEESAAYGMFTGELQQQREDALSRYLTRPYGDEIEGRSQAVSSDVLDAVEWIMPDLMEMFVSGDEIVAFEPKGPEDEQQAKQETDYVNHVVTEKNNAFLTFNSWFKDALVQKVGYVKAYHEEYSDIQSETYQGMSEEELDALLNDPEVEVIGQSAYPDPMGAVMPPMPPAAGGPDEEPEPPAPPMLYDVKLRRTVPKSCIRYEPIPPEEVLVSIRAKTVSLQEVGFVQHRPKKTISELRQMGYNIPDDIGDDVDESTESNSRDQYGEESMEDSPHLRQVTYRETYIRVDQDGDGIAELRRVCLVGSTVLHNDVCDLIPIAALTPIIMSHRHIGLSYYDLIQDLAKIKTAILRGLLDNLYLANNGRHAVDVNAVRIEDMLVSRPGGIVRVDGPPSNAIMPLVSPDMSGAAIQGLTYIDDVKESRVGVSKYSQGLDPDTLVKTASQSQQLMTAANKRVKMIARCFAETGVKDLFLIVHALTLKHGSKDEKIRLRNKWVLVNPREWVQRSDLTINVGLGTGNGEQMFLRLMQILAMQKEALAFNLTDLAKIRNTLGKLTQYAGFKNAELFWNEPDPQNPPQPPKPPEVQAAEITAQAQIQSTEKQSQIKHGTEMQTKAAELQSAERVEMMRLQAQEAMKDKENQTRLAIAALQEETKRGIAATRPVAQPQVQ